MSAEGDERPTIIVGVDGSEPSRRALEWAARQARMTGAELNVLTTWEFPATYGWAPPYPPGFDPEGDTRKALQQTVDEVLGASADVPMHLTVVEGHPAPVLVEQSQGADLLVVGSRGHGAFVGMLIGSVSEHCAAHAQCPVVVVRHPDDKG